MMYGQSVYDRQKRDEILAKIDEMLNNINTFIDADPEYATAVRSALKARADQGDTNIAMLAALTNRGYWVEPSSAMSNANTNPQIPTGYANAWNITHGHGSRHPGRQGDCTMRFKRDRGVLRVEFAFPRWLSRLVGWRADWRTVAHGKSHRSWDWLDGFVGVEVTETLHTPEGPEKTG